MNTPVSLQRVIATLTLLGIVWAGGCAVGPDYKRPAVDEPAAYRTADSGPALSGGTNTFADLGWWQVFGDPQLQGYVHEALTNNWDLRIAAARVLQAEASAQVSRSRFFPSIGVGGNVTMNRASEVGPTAMPPGTDPTSNFGTVYASMSTYEVDLWGKIRRANQAVRAQLLATEAAQRTVRQQLVAAVAASYLELLELDYELEVARRSYSVRTNSLALTSAREEGGVASLQDVVQARVLVATADATIVDVQRRQQQKENELCILLGRNPGPVERGIALRQQAVRAEVPPGLPSSLLERRPDIQSAEQELIAANARVGEAKAAFFPQLTLTGAFGYQSVSLNDLFTAPAKVWQFGPSLTVPIFTGGQLTGQYKFAKARFEESVSQYQKTVQGAFRDVSDALIQYQKSKEFTVRQEQSTQARREAADLASIRYDGGVTSYLEFLYSEQELLTAELNLARAIGTELISVVQLYRALGGGWQMPAADSSGATASNP